MQSPGAVDRFRHFEFKNPPIIEVGRTSDFGWGINNQNMGENPPVKVKRCDALKF